MADKRSAPRRDWARRRLEATKAPKPQPTNLCKPRGRPRRDPRSAVQRKVDARLEASRANWARMHPDAAAHERSLRKNRAALVSRWKHKNEGTPETHEHASRCNQGALVRLYKNGELNAEQLLAAVEIGLVVERIAADVTVRTASLETRVDVTRLGDGSFFERLGQVRREAAYTRWREQLKQPAPVLDMIVGEPVGFTIVARRYRMHHRTAKRLLIEALDLWPEILGHMCKMIDHDDLQAAHVRLLA